MAVLPGDFNVYTTCIHSDTSDGSTVFLDSSGNGKPIIAYGSIAHSTDRAKFGSSSIECSSTNDYLSLGVSYVSPGLMIDFYLYLSAFPSEDRYLLYGKNAQDSCFIKISTAGVISFQWFYEPAVKPGLFLDGTLSLGEWHHIYVFAGVSSSVIETTCGDGAYSWPGYITSTTLTTQLGINGIIENGSGTTVSDTCGTIPFEQYLTPNTVYIGNMPCYLDEIRITCDDPVSGDFTPYTSPYPQSVFTVSGKVMEGTANVARVVRAYDRTTGELLGSTTSDATTGEYTIANLPASATSVYVVCLDDDDSPDFEALIHDRVVPGEE